jgi:hypothetical protein
MPAIAIRLMIRASGVGRIMMGLFSVFCTVSAILGPPNRTLRNMRASHRSNIRAARELTKKVVSHSKEVGSRSPAWKAVKPRSSIGG